VLYVDTGPAREEDSRGSAETTPRAVGEKYTSGKINWEGNKRQKYGRLQEKREHPHSPQGDLNRNWVVPTKGPVRTFYEKAAREESRSKTHKDDTSKGFPDSYTFSSGAKCNPRATLKQACKFQRPLLGVPLTCPLPKEENSFLSLETQEVEEAKRAATTWPGDEDAKEKSCA